MKRRAKIFAMTHGPRWTPDNFASVVLAGNPVPSQDQIVPAMVRKLAEWRAYREKQSERIAILEERIAQFWAQFN